MVKFYILGPIELSGGRDPSQLLRHSRDLAILAYVAVVGAEGGSCTRDELVAMFWPESNSGRSRNALNQALHRIRRATADDALVSQGQGLRLNREHLDTDVGRFWKHLASGEAESAVSLYRGALLSGVHIRRAGPFEDWLEQERTRVKGAAREAARGLRDSAAGRDELDLAISCARRAAEISDREEDDIRWLIELLARSGDRVAALREYERFARWLESDLEIEPSPETQALVASFMSNVPIGEGMAERSGRHKPEEPAADSVDPPCSVQWPPPASSVAATSTESRTALDSRGWRRSAAWGLTAVVAVTAVTLLATSLGEPASPPDLGLSADALVYYRRGKEYVRAGNDGGREENWRLALEMFQRASELSPRSAAAYAAMGTAHLRLFHWGFDRSTERQVMAKAALDRGSELDSSHPDVNRALGWYYQWGERDYARALQAGHRALESLPNDLEALTLVFAANRRMGQASEAIPAVRQLARTGGSAAYWAEWAATHIGLREYEEALGVLDEALGLFPTNGGLHYQKWLTALLSTGDPAAGRRVLAEARARIGPENLWPWEFGQFWLSRQYQEALAVLEREKPETFQTQQGDLPIDLMIGLVQGLAGQDQVARNRYRRAIEPLEAMILARPDEPWFHGWLAVATAAAGDTKRALAEVEVTRELAELEPDRWENPYLVQEVVLHAYILAGEHSQAIELLQELLESDHYRAISRPWVALDPRFDPLRSHPMWERLGVSPGRSTVP